MFIVIYLLIWLWHTTAYSLANVDGAQGTVGIPGEFGFLKKNELFVGRVAMLGFAAELVGEVCSA